MAYDNTNSGLLTKNQRKEQDTHPDYTGSINVDGTDYWLSGWIKQGREGTKLEGQKYFSLSLRPKDQQQAPRQSAPRPQSQGPRQYGQSQPRQQPQRQQPQADSGFDDMDDDIPF